MVPIPTKFTLMNNPCFSLRSSLVALTALAVVATADLRADHVGLSIGVPFPNGYFELDVGRDHYYVHRGVFYRRGPSGLVVVSAPRGAIVRELPPHYVRIYAGDVVYFRYGDVYYRQVPQGYVVVEPPTVQMPPPMPAEQSQSVWVGPTEFVFKDGQFFRKTPEGLVWTEAPLGAVTKVLPIDATSIWHQDIEYFECEGVFFRKTPEGYRVVTAPWKK